MSNILKWTQAIRNEDGDKMSLWSLRSLTLIDEQYQRQQNLKDSFSNSLLRILRYASDPSLDNPIQMSEALKWIIEEVETAVITK